ncbi:MAG: alpha/beta hydrolase [Acidobacteria bacterium]|nr:alpha/beta hydrolase [Acidobacteriota bacterium]
MKESCVEFPNRRDKLLRGMVHLPDRTAAPNPAPGVVFFHGFTGDRMESHWIFIKCARALARNGVASLRFDFYGSGESAGEFREVTLQSEIADARDAIRFIRRQKAIDPGRIGLCGLSLGGCVAAAVASGARAKCAVLWSAVAHPSILQRLALKMGKQADGDAASIEYDAREVSLSFLREASEVDPLKALAQFFHPTLVIHPGKDETVPRSHAQDLLRAAGVRIKRKVIIPGADHTYTSLAAESEVIRRTVDWFRAYL